MITINKEQGVYVIPSGEGYTCLGFDVAYNRAWGYVRWLKDESQSVLHIMPHPDLKGTLEGYKEYERALHAVSTYNFNTGKRCPVELTPQLIGLEHKRVEVVDEYGEKRRFIVGKSMGYVPIHLEIKTRRSTGGSGVTGAPFKSIKVVG
jgi:hypothetical protein